MATRFRNDEFAGDSVSIHDIVLGNKGGHREPPLPDFGPGRSAQGQMTNGAASVFENCPAMCIVLPAACRVLPAT